MPNIFLRSIVFVGAVALFGVTVSACRSGTEASGQVASYANVGSDATYVGKEVCGTCHKEQYDTFIHSEMGRSFKPATLANSDANFDRPQPIYDDHNDLYYQPFHVGEDLFVREYRLAGRDTVHERVEQIDYIVGSGQHTNSHIMDVNGYLYQMPLTWYAQDGKWSLPPKYEGGNNSRFDRPIPLECMTCHNGTPDFVAGSENRYRHVPDGIDCERCHGPGSVHVDAIKTGRIVDTSTEIDRTIVNPRKLPADRQFDICQRCHAQGAAVFADGKTPLDFRPSQRLASVENVFWPRFTDTVERFTMASHPDRLKMSECFVQSRELPDQQPMTCITCHNPHVGIKTLGQEHYNNVCQSCHGGTDGPAAAADSVTPVRAATTVTCTEDPATRAAANDNCVSCHMPVSGTQDIPHVRITDHFIRKVEEKSTEQLTKAEVLAQQEFLGMASIIDDAPSLKNTADGYLVYYEQITNHPGFLDSAAVFLDRSGLPADETLDSKIRLWYLQRDYDLITSFSGSLSPEDIDDAWTAFRIGDAQLSSGTSRGAVRFLARAVELSPEHLRFLSKLGDGYHRDGQTNAAVAIYDRVLEAHPKYAEVYNNRGFSRIVLGDIVGAEQDFVAALALNPDQLQSIANLASLYYSTGRLDEARPYARRLLEIEPTNARYRELWELLESSSNSSG